MFIFCIVFPVNAHERGENYKLYECEYFKINDKVAYSFYWTYWERTDFVGIVTRIDPKPTNVK